MGPATQKLRRNCSTTCSFEAIDNTMEHMDSTEMSQLFGNFYDHQNFTLDDSSQPDTAVETSENSGNTGTRKRRLVKKCPDAPKRFKSAYICFVTERMDDVKKTLSNDTKVTEVMKVLASLWKTLPPLERIRYEKIADADKARYFEEMNVYEGPMQVPNKRQKKPAGAPKRGMSAFLSFSQQMRPQVRAMFPDLKNTDISTVLAQRWHAANEDEKRPHLERELRDREKYHVDMAKWKLEEKEPQIVVGSNQQYFDYQPAPQQQQQSNMQLAYQQFNMTYNAQNNSQSSAHSSNASSKKSPRAASSNTNNNNTAKTQISQTFTSEQGAGSTFTENEMKTKMTLDFLDLNSWDEAHAQYGVTGNGDLLQALLLSQQQNQHHLSQSQQDQQQLQQQNNSTSSSNKRQRGEGRQQQGLPSLDQMNRFLHGNQTASTDTNNGEGHTPQATGEEEEQDDENSSHHNGSNIDSNDSDTNRFWDEALNHFSHNSNSPDEPASPQVATTEVENNSSKGPNDDMRSYHSLPSHGQSHAQATTSQSHHQGQRLQQSSYYPANITAAAFAANNVQQHHYAFGPLYEKSSSSSSATSTAAVNTNQVILPLTRGSVRTHEQQQQHQQLLWQQMTAMAARATTAKSNQAKNNSITSSVAATNAAGGAGTGGLSSESSKVLAAASAAVKSRKNMLASTAAANAAAASAAAYAATSAKKTAINTIKKSSSISALSKSSLLPIELAALSASSNGGRQGFYMSNISKLQQILDQSGFSALYDKYHTGTTPPATSPVDTMSATTRAAAAAGGGGSGGSIRRRCRPGSSGSGDGRSQQPMSEADELHEAMLQSSGSVVYGQPSYVEEDGAEEQN